MNSNAAQGGMQSQSSKWHSGYIIMAYLPLNSTANIGLVA